MYLQQYATCLDSARSLDLGVYVSGPTDQEISAKVFETLDEYQSLIRPQCLHSLKPLVCLYFFHLCDGNRVIMPSKKQCENIEDVCDNELKLIQLLPNLPITIPEVLSGCVPSNPFDNKDCSEFIPAIKYCHALLISSFLHRYLQKHNTPKY